jgi:hypothetical protein
MADLLPPLKSIPVKDRLSIFYLECGQSLSMRPPDFLRKDCPDEMAALTAGARPTR